MRRCALNTDALSFLQPCQLKNLTTTLMAIQLYFQGPSRYHTASSLWLGQESPRQGLDNFGYLMTNFENLFWNTLAYWPVDRQNGSASYTRNGGPEGLLVLGPYDGPAPQHGQVQIPESCFFYEDDRFDLLTRPTHVRYTPFLLRGMATALKDRLLTQHAGSKPFVFWVRYDGNPNRPGVLRIRRHQW